MQQNTEYSQNKHNSDGTRATYVFSYMCEAYRLLRDLRLICVRFENISLKEKKVF